MSELNTIKKLSKTELQFMKEIWNHPEGITSDEIYLKYNQAQGTKSTILHRIIKKEFVNLTKKGKHYIYTPKITQKEYEEMLMNQTVNKLESVISVFFEKEKLTEDQLDKVKVFLEKLKDE